MTSRDLSKNGHILQHLLSLQPNASPAGNCEWVKPQAETIAKLLRDMEGSSEKESSDRECLVCTKEEVSIVFLLRTHEVMCANCNDDFGKKGKATCPCCRVPIEQRIRVFGAS